MNSYSPDHLNAYHYPPAQPNASSTCISESKLAFLNSNCLAVCRSASIFQSISALIFICIFDLGPAFILPYVHIYCIFTAHEPAYKSAQQPTVYCNATIQSECMSVFNSPAVSPSHSSFRISKDTVLVLPLLQNIQGHCSNLPTFLEYPRTLLYSSHCFRISKDTVLVFPLLSISHTLYLLFSISPPYTVLIRTRLAKVMRLL